MKHIFLLTVFLMTLPACALQPEITRHEVAERLASPAWMLERQIPAGDFKLTAFERMHTPNAPANIYIAGDGDAVIPFTDTNKTGYVVNPTPKNPVALHLASKDKAENVAYLARPCQYTRIRTGKECAQDLWQDGQYSAQVLHAMNAAIDDIKKRYDLTSLNLIGYSGGATLAGILAAERNDVASLRTVNGKLDLNAMRTSLPKLVSMPQHHFAGEHDEIVGTTALQNYMNALGDDRCADSTIIHEATHDKGFVNPWPKLLKDHAPHCKTAAVKAFEPVPARETVFVPRMSGDKK